MESIPIGILLNSHLQQKKPTKPIPLERKESSSSSSIANANVNESNNNLIKLSKGGLANTSVKQNGNNSKSLAVGSRDMTCGNISGSASTSNLLESSVVSTHNLSNIHNSTTNLNYSGASSFTNATTTTNTTTDSGVSSVGRKEKKNKIWAILSGGRNKSSNVDKQKSATLGREKDKTKKSSQLTKELESSMKHRWSTGLPKLQPLPSNVSKESLVSLTLSVYLQSSIYF